MGTPAQVSQTPATTPAVDRKALRASAMEAANTALAAGDPADVSAALSQMVAAYSPATKASGGPRVVLDKADPAEVAAYFASTGLPRKEIATAAGVSTSVIATVQNEKGDRWSTVTFEAKRTLIDQYMVDHADEIAARAATAAAEAAAKQAAIDLKAANKVARAQAATTKAAAAVTQIPVAATAAPKAKGKGNRQPSLAAVPAQP